METVRKSVRVGRYDILQQFGNVGDTSSFYTDVDIPRSEAAWFGVMLEGSWELTKRPEAVTDWPILRAGMNTGELPDNLAGDYQYTVREKVHYLCVTDLSGAAVRGVPVSRLSGEHFVVPRGQIFVLGKGSVNIGGDLYSGVYTVVARNQDVAITCASDVLGIMIPI